MKLFVDINIYFADSLRRAYIELVCTNIADDCLHRKQASNVCYVENGLGESE